MSENLNIEIADVFERFGSQLGKLPPDVWKVIQAIKNCRTGALGGHLLNCDSCEYKSQSYNSCRNRHCPKCGFAARAAWVESRMDELLDCPYFHVVFTLPSELRPLILRNKEVFYKILFKAASTTIRDVAKDKLNAETGAIGVLHTWSQTLIDHPHLHFIVPGGGLSSSKTQWVKCHQSFFLPIRILSKVFRGKFLKLAEEAFNTGQLKFKGAIDHLSHPGLFQDLLIECASKEFIVYAKEPFAGPAAVLKYLGQYTHRIAISNYRLVKIEGDNVHFMYRDPKDASKKKIMALSAKEFMRRFLLHVLPKGFVRIRHFGFLSNRHKKTNIELARKLTGMKERLTKEPPSAKDFLKRIMGFEPDRCPACEGGAMKKFLRLKPFYSTA